MNVRMHVQGIMGLICGLALLGSLVHAQKSEADTYYVATDGSDSNSGTEAQPFQTLDRGIRDLRPGDTLYVKNGTYTGGLMFIPSGTSWGNPVTVAAYPGHSPVIVPAGPGSTTLYLVTSRYIVIDGFVIYGTNGGDAVKITWGWGGIADHIRIQNSEILYAGGSGIAISDGSDGNEFINLQIHDNGTDGLGYGFYIVSSDNLVEGCSIHDHTGWGIHAWHSTGTGVNNNVIRNNVIYNNGRSGRGDGILLTSGNGNQASNNDIWRNNGGIRIEAASNTYVDHNTIHGNPDFGIFIGAGNSNTLVEFNNIYDTDDSRAIIDEGISTSILP
jgi:parallel beta-helix repeat protein